MRRVTQSAAFAGGVVLGSAVVGAPTVSADSVTSETRVALPPRQLSLGPANAIAKGRLSYRAHGRRSTARAAQGPGCTIYAGDPYILVRHDPQPERRRLVVGVGWQFCSRGIAQRTQVCLYKTAPPPASPLLRADSWLSARLL